MALLLVLLSLGVSPAATADENLHASILRVDSSQVPWRDVYVNVSDSRGLPITGLDRNAFTLTEDGAPQTPDRFAMSSDGQVPIAFGLVMDVSGSMNEAGKLDAAKQAAKRVVASLGPQDTAAVISFGDTAQVVQGITSNQDALNAAIDGLQASGNTALYDAIQKTTLLAEALPQPLKVQLIVTDGTDTKSATKLPEVLQNLRTSGSVAYVVGIGGDVDRRVLDQIAQAGNGDALYTDDPSVLAGSFQNILNQLRLTYLLRYRAPMSTTDQHTVAATVRYQGQTAQAETPFSAAPKVVAVDVSGIIPGETLPAGDHDVQATLRSGSAARMEILLDGTSTASSTGQPTSLGTELSGLAAGDHDLEVRVADTAGSVTEQHVPFTVQAPPLTVAAAIPVAAEQTAADETKQQNSAFPKDWWWLLWLLVVAVLAAIGVWLGWLTRSKRGAGAGAGSATDDATLDLEAPSGAVVAPAASGGETVETARVSIESDAQRQEVALGTEPLSIGRDADNTVVLHDLHVSRHHARILGDEGAYWIEDLKSQNGTLLNGQVAIDRRKLEPGDQFVIGAATLTYLGPSPVASVANRNGADKPDASEPSAVSGLSR
jgi:VWFA-related protein